MVLEKTSHRRYTKEQVFAEIPRKHGHTVTGRRYILNGPFIGFWNVSVILTYVELCIAVGGICAAADGRVWPAVAGLALCGVCDMFDGKIARLSAGPRTRRCLASRSTPCATWCPLAVLPSALGYAFGIRGWGTAVLMLYTLAAVIRLGYFNVTEQKRQQTTDANRTSFEGLPVTWAAVIVPLCCLLSLCTGTAFPWILGVVLGAMAFFFLARITVGKPQI